MSKKHVFNKCIAYGALIIVLYIVQTTLVDLIEVYKIKPNLLFCAVICIAVFEKHTTGAVCALFAGYLSQTTGVSVLIWLLCAFFIGYACRSVSNLSLGYCFILCFVANFLYDLSAYIGLYFQVSNARDILIALRISAFGAMYSAVFVFIFYFLIRKIHIMLQKT